MAGTVSASSPGHVEPAGTTTHPADSRTKKAALGVALVGIIIGSLIVVTGTGRRGPDPSRCPGRPSGDGA